MYSCICDKCGNAVHIIGKADANCDFCDAVISNEETGIRDPLIEKGEKLLMTQKYSEAIDTITECIEIYPQIGYLYWERFMAKNNCCSDDQLLSKGVVFDDPDYGLAMKYSSIEEQKTFLLISEMRERIAKGLCRELKQKQRESLLEDITNKRNVYLKRLEELKNQFIQYADELDESEMCLKNATEDCQILIDNYKGIISVECDQFGRDRTYAESGSEVDYDEFIKRRAMLKKHRLVCQDAKLRLDALDNNQAFVERNSLKENCATKEELLRKKIEEISALKTEMSAYYAEIAKDMSKYSSAMEEVYDIGFSKAATVLGNDVTKKVFSEVLLR